MQPLTFPPYRFTTSRVDGKQMIFDSVRSKYVRLTPEEWVRQHLVQFLIHDRGTPVGLIAVEQSVTYLGTQRRADVVVYGRRHTPVLLAECKAPEVRIRQDAFDQIAAYNTVFGARCLVITNGLDVYVWWLDPETSSYRFLDAIPSYDDFH